MVQPGTGKMKKGRRAGKKSKKGIVGIENRLEAHIHAHWESN
jgi:hypothetical protein